MKYIFVSSYIFNFNNLIDKEKRLTCIMNITYKYNFSTHYDKMDQKKEQSTYVGLKCTPSDYKETKYLFVKQHVECRLPLFQHYNSNKNIFYFYHVLFI